MLKQWKRKYFFWKCLQTSFSSLQMNSFKEWDFYSEILNSQVQTPVFSTGSRKRRRQEIIVNHTGLSKALSSDFFFRPSKIKVSWILCTFTTMHWSSFSDWDVLIACCDTFKIHSTLCSVLTSLATVISTSHNYSLVRLGRATWGYND